MLVGATVRIDTDLIYDDQMEEVGIEPGFPAGLLHGGDVVYARVGLFYPTIDAALSDGRSHYVKRKFLTEVETIPVGGPVQRNAQGNALY